jgi:hypothetical protein
MNCRIIAASQTPSESMTNRSMMGRPFELIRTDRILRGIGGVPVLVSASDQPVVSTVVLGGWHELEERWRTGSATGLLRSIPAMLGHCFGAYATPGGTALFCFDCIALRVTVSTYGGPSVNAELGAWESRPLARLRPV